MEGLRSIIAARDSVIAALDSEIEELDAQLAEAQRGLGGTPLHQAAAKGHVEQIRVLVRELGAQVEAKDEVGGMSAARP